MACQGDRGDKHKDIRLAQKLKFHSKNIVENPIIVTELLFFLAYGRQRAFIQNKAITRNLAKANNLALIIFLTMPLILTIQNYLAIARKKLIAVIQKGH